MRSVITTLFLAFSGYSFGLTDLSNDSLKVVIKLKSINNVLTFNQPHVTAGALEYSWEVRINSDNNNSTGDNEGYDVSLVLENTKYGTSPSYTGSIISGTDQHTWIYSGSTKNYGNQLISYFNFSDSTITLVGLKSWPELTNVNTGDQISARTFYNSPAGIQTDNISPFSLSANSGQDIQGDVPSAFIDLLSVKVELPTSVSLKENLSIVNKIIIYPNPGNGVFYLSEGAKANIHIYDDAGRRIQTLENKNEIDLRPFPKGIYIIQISDGINHSSARVAIY
ncbi:MAG: T9SS type A sorting domain-containing protein [Bacteroidia bacterium]